MTRGTVSVLLALLFAVTFMTPMIPFATGIALYSYYVVLTVVSAILVARVMQFSDSKA